MTNETITSTGLPCKLGMMSLHPLIDGDLITCRMRVDRKHVVFVKGIFEASEGLGALFAERGGDLTLAAPRSRAAEFRVLLDDLVAELGAVIEKDSPT